MNDEVKFLKFLSHLQISRVKTHGLPDMHATHRCKESEGACWGRIRGPGGHAVGRNPVGRHSLCTIILTETQLGDII